jgi:hypothetical protein
VDLLEIPLSIYVTEADMHDIRGARKDYEQHCELEETCIYIAMTRLMARHLAAAPPFVLRSQSEKTVVS